MRPAECDDAVAVSPPPPPVAGAHMDCLDSSSGGSCGREEEDEEQAFLQTLQPPRSERREAAVGPKRGPGAKAPAGRPQEGGLEEQALLQKYRRGPQLQPSTARDESPPSRLPPHERVLHRPPPAATAAQGHPSGKPSSTPGPDAATVAPAIGLRTVSSWPSGPLALAVILLVSVTAFLGLAAALHLKRRDPHAAQESAKAWVQEEPTTPCKDLAAGGDEGCSFLVQPTPPPMPRLAHVGTSFVVPLTRIMACTDTSLSVEVPVSPAVWPLRAFFSRQEAGQGAWGRVELTVDIIDAAGLPPLLSCSPSRPSHSAELDAGSGGTGATCDMALAGSGEGEPAADGHAWLEICGGSGSVAARLLRAPGGCTVQRPGHASWDLQAHLEAGSYWILVCRRGQEVGLATRLPHGKFAGSEEEEYIQIDTQPDTSSPESVLLLMCMLATMVFMPDPGSEAAADADA